MTDPVAGRFFHVGWEITGGLDPLAAHIASFHEFGHAALNACSAWGGLLQALAIAHLNTDDDRFDARLAAAVKASQLCHESYATTASIRMSAGVAGSETFWDAQSAYGRYLEVARAVGPPEDSGWNEGTHPYEVRMAALVACMQSPAIVGILEHGTEGFTLASVPARDWPDRRLSTLRSQATELWASGPNGGPDERFEEALERACQVLRDSGHPTLTRNEYSRVLRAVTEQLDESSASTISIDQHGDIGLPGLFTSEVVRMREPLPAELEVLDASRPVDLSWTSSHSGRHLFVTARRMGTIRQQYALADDPGWPDDEPVVAALLPALRQVRAEPSTATIERLRLVVLASPRDLRALMATETVLVCISYACLVIGSWRRVWYDSIRDAAFHACLIDMPLSDVVDVWLANGTQLQMGMATGHQPSSAAVVFRTDGGEPLLWPVSEGALFGITTLVTTRSGGAVVHDDDLLTDVETVGIASLLDHLAVTDAVRAVYPSRASRRLGRR